MKCKGLFGLLFGHSYRAVITKGVPAAKLSEVQGNGKLIIELVDKTRPETYHGIYCKRCGHCINDYQAPEGDK